MDFQLVIAGSVGQGGKNQPADVRLVQHLLNDALAREKAQLLAVDGMVGPKTIGAIRRYQTGNGLTTDGRIDPNGPTIKRLVGAHLASLEAGVLRVQLAPGDALPTPPGVQDVLSSAAAAYLARLRA